MRGQRPGQDSLRLSASASRNPPYRLPKHPPVMYISAVSRPSNVLEVQVACDKPRTLIPAFPRAEDPRSLMKATLRLFCFAVMFLLVRQSAFAQGAATGDLHVSVKDPKGNVVTNATVTVDASGFAKAEATGVAITVGGMAELPVTLTVAGGKEIIEVSSQAELVE